MRWQTAARVWLDCAGVRISSGRIHQATTTGRYVAVRWAWCCGEWRIRGRLFFSWLIWHGWPWPAIKTNEGV